MKRYSFYEEQVLKYYSRTGEKYEGKSGKAAVRYILTHRGNSPVLDMATYRAVKKYKPSNRLNAITRLSQ